MRDAFFLGTSFALVRVILLHTACTSPTPTSPPSSDATVAQSSAPSTSAAVADARTDCEIVLQDLELTKEGAAIPLLNQAPDGPTGRDAMLAGVDRYVGVWKTSGPRVRDASLRALGDAYIAVMLEHRKVIAGLPLRHVPPSPPPAPAPTVSPSGVPLTPEQLARQAALREAAEFGMPGALSKGDFWVLEEDGRRAFHESRGRFLDGWDPLLRRCDP